MIRSITSNLAILLVALVLINTSGCKTGELILSAAMTARVIDSRSGAPIPGALVTLYSPADPESIESGRTDELGVARLPRLHGHLVAFGDPVHTPAVARFEAQGYSPKEIDDVKGLRFFDGSAPVVLTPLNASN